MKQILKKIIPNDSQIYFRLLLMDKVGFNLWIINLVFQRIFRRHSKLDFSVNFTSTISETNIELNKDLTTLASFAISGGCYFQAINGIKLGKNFLFAPGVKLISANHDFYEHSKSIKTSSIVIGDNVWLGANVIILPGVKLANGCIVGAGSVVTKSFEEENSIITGNPAKAIGKK